MHLMSLDAFISVIAKNRKQWQRCVKIGAVKDEKGAHNTSKEPEADLKQCGVVVSAFTICCTLN